MTEDEPYINFIKAFDRIHDVGIDGVSIWGRSECRCGVNMSVDVSVDESIVVSVDVLSMV